MKCRTSWCIRVVRITKSFGDMNHPTHKIPIWMWTIDKRRMISVINRGKQTTTKEVTIRKVPLGGHETDKTIDRWIKDISDLHRSKPPPSVLYTKVEFINYVDRIQGGLHSKNQILILACIMNCVTFNAPFKLKSLL